MPNVSLGGLVSGMDTDTVIQKLMDVEKQRVTRQEAQKQLLQAKRDAWEKVDSSLQTLRSKLDALRWVSGFRVRKATLTDDSIATVTASAGASMTTHRLQVTQLAQANVIATKQYATANTSLGVTGRIQIGGASGPAIDVVADDTLNSLRDKINASSGSGVSAEVTKVGTQYQLVLTAKETGKSISVTDLSGTAAADLELMSSGAPVHEIAPAKNAIFTLDGVTYSDHTSNTISDILPNLTITLKKTSAANTDTFITIGPDSDKVADAVQGWVDALNDTLTLLKDQTAYDSNTKTAGALNGDGLARQLQTSLRGMLANQVAAPAGAPTALSQLGITTGAWKTDDYGKVLLDRDKLKAALEQNPDDVARVFGALRNNVALGGQAHSSPIDTASAADAINGDTDPTRIGTSGGGWISSDVPSTAVPQVLTITLSKTTSIDQVRLYLPDTTGYGAATHGIKDFTLEYYSTTRSQWVKIADVTGNQSTLRQFDFPAEQASQVRLTVTATNGGTDPARVAELQVNETTGGSAAAMYSYVNSSLAYSTGSIDSREAVYDDQISDIDKTIEKMNTQMADHEAALRAQFTAMEAALQKLQSQGTALLSQFMGTSSTNSK